MAFDPSNFLAPITPPASMDFSNAIQQAMQARQRAEELKRLREQLEETKRHNIEEEQMRKLAEQGQMARANLQVQKQREKDAAQAQRELDERRRTALEDVSKAGQNYGAIRALAPRFSALGMGFEDQGSVDGQPRFRITPDAAADARAQAERQAVANPYQPSDAVYGSPDVESAQQSLARMEGIGFPDEQGDLSDFSGADRPPPTLADQMLMASPEAGELDAATQDALSPGDADMATAGEYGADAADVNVSGLGMQPGTLPFGDAYAQALAAGRYARERGRPARGPEPADLTGGIPNDVIDFGSIAAENQQRTGPTLNAAVNAYPDAAGENRDAFRQSAAQTAAGIAPLGLDPVESLKLYNDARARADSVINSQIQAGAQAKRHEDSKEPKRTEQAALIDRGLNNARKAFNDNSIKQHQASQAAAGVVRGVLEDEDVYNDDLAVNQMMLLSGNKGPQTEKDAERVTGLSKASTPEQIKIWLHNHIEGGTYPAIRQSMLEFVKRMEAEDDAVVFDYLDEMERQASENRDPLVAQGYRDFVNGLQLSPTVRARYLKRKGETEDEEEEEPEGVTQPTGAVDDFETELMVQATDNDLDPEKIGIVMRGESGGKAEAVNADTGASGTMQLMPNHLQRYGVKPEAFRAMSASEQLPYNIRYLKEQGITADSPPQDYVMAVAAPAFIGKPGSTVVYKKGSKAWEQNAPWRPADGGDITVDSIVAHYGLGGGGGSSVGGLPPPKNAAERELFEALGGKL